MKALFILLLLASCGDDTFKKVEKLDSFKIVAIEASQPEVNPGGSSTLRLFVSDTAGPVGGRVITGNYIACIDPGISLGAPVSCAHDPAAVSGNYNIDTTAPDLANNLYTGYSGSLNITVPNTILIGRSSRDQSNGVGYLVIFNFSVDGKTITSFKKINATNRASLNNNPNGSAILLNGAPVVSLPQEGDILDLTTSTVEDYVYIEVDGTSQTRTEEIDVAWYATGGNFDRPKSNLGEEVKLTEDPPSGAYLILAVVRDDRGGQEVVRITIP
jgi:hypothetical protein